MITHSCTCPSCIRSNEFNAALDQIPEGPVRNFFRDQNDCLRHLEDDLDYYKSILDGSWPSARKHLEDGLAAVGRRETWETLTNSSTSRSGGVTTKVRAEHLLEIIELINENKVNDNRDYILNLLTSHYNWLLGIDATINLSNQKVECTSSQAKARSIEGD